MNGPGLGSPLGDCDQVTSMLLMVRPESFGHNPQTAPTNAGQRGAALACAAVTRQALREFDQVVDTLVWLGARPRADGLLCCQLPGGPRPIRPGHAGFPRRT